MRTLQPVYALHVHNTVSLPNSWCRFLILTAVFLLFVLPLLSIPRMQPSARSHSATSFTAAQSSKTVSDDGVDRPAPVVGAQNTPPTQTFTGTASLRSWSSEEIGVGTTPIVKRLQPTGTSLLDGSVLIVGGFQSPPGPDTDPAAASAELYNPVTGTFRITGALVQPRFSHTATRLLDGRVLITGGFEYMALESAEIYDPATQTFSATGSMSRARTGHTATLLPDGRVLIVGGDDINPLSSTAEIYDPKTGTFSTTGSLQRRRSRHSATLLHDGRVLVAGGYGSIVYNGEIYDPATGTWTTTGSTQEPRNGHTATLLDDGRVLLVGGSNESTAAFRSAELYDPVTGLFTATASMQTPRRGHTATLLSDGTVVIIGGFDGTTGSVANVERYDPARNIFIAAGTMIEARELPATALLADGTILVVGGTLKESSAELYDPVTRTSDDTSRKLKGQRFDHTATLLPNGTVLIVGGIDYTTNSSHTLADAALYEPETRSFSTTGAMRENRYAHTATLLESGKVLITGGFRGAESLHSAEIYDPAKGSFATTGSMAVPRMGHTATLMQDGRVLITGGGRINNSGTIEPYRSAELYDPTTGRFTTVGSMQMERQLHTATLLVDGTVLVVGGYNFRGQNTAEIYDPATRTFSTTNAMTDARYRHTATRLLDGTVLIAGGMEGLTILASTEIYDPRRHRFIRSDSLVEDRYSHEATLMDDGIVLFTGGYSGSVSTPDAADVEVYDPGPQAFKTAGTMVGKSTDNTATVLEDGTVLIVGGTTGIVEVGKLRIENTYTGTLTIPTGWVSTATPTVTVTGSTTGTTVMDGSVNDGPWFRLQPGVAVETTVPPLEDGADQPIVLRLRDTSSSALVVVRGSIDIDTPRSRVLLPIIWR